MVVHLFLNNNKALDFLPINSIKNGGITCDQHGIEHVFTQPGNPQQNAYVERFNRTVRYECLNQYLFRDLSEVQDYTTDWQYFYNHERPHMSVNGCPPIFKQ
jgi:putative transposase